RKAVAVDIARNRRRFAAEHGIDLVPVDLLRVGRGRDQDQRTSEHGAARQVSHGLLLCGSVWLSGVLRLEEPRRNARARSAAAEFAALVHTRHFLREMVLREMGRVVSSMRNHLDTSSVAQSLDVRTRLKGSLRIPGWEK